jgi:hypothetical protein
MRTTLASALLLVLLAACGRDGGGAARGGSGVRAIDRSSPEVVLEEAHRALAAGDWEALAPFLTADGRTRVEADLKAWHEALTDPATGPSAASRLRMPEGEAGRAVARRAIAEGDPGALLRLLVLADPRPPLGPLPRTVRAPDLERVELAYPARGVERRRVVLSRGPDGWRIDRLQL